MDVKLTIGGNTFKASGEAEDVDTLLEKWITAIATTTEEQIATLIANAALINEASATVSAATETLQHTAQPTSTKETPHGTKS